MIYFRSILLSAIVAFLPLLAQGQAGEKISAMPNGNPAQSGDLIPIARSGSNYSITPGSIAALGGTITGVTAGTGLTGGGVSGGVTLNLSAPVTQAIWDKGGAVYNVKAYGAICDGSTHPLSGMFGTLAAAQAVYPPVTALTQEIDWAAIQTVINEADANSAGTGKVIDFPAEAQCISQDQLIIGASPSCVSVNPTSLCNPVEGITIQSQRLHRGYGSGGGTITYTGPALHTGFVYIRNARAGALDGVNLDANGLADFALQMIHIPGDPNTTDNWKITSSSFRHGVIANVMLGDNLDTNCNGGSSCGNSGEVSNNTFDTCDFASDGTIHAAAEVRQISANGFSNTFINGLFAGSGTWPTYAIWATSGTVNVVGGAFNGFGGYSFYVDGQTGQVPAGLYVIGPEVQDSHLLGVDTSGAVVPGGGPGSIATEWPIVLRDLHYVDIYGAGGNSIDLTYMSGWGNVVLDGVRITGNKPVNIATTGQFVYVHGVMFDDAALAYNGGASFIGHTEKLIGEYNVAGTAYLATGGGTMTLPNYTSAPNGIEMPSIYPSTDSTNAFQFRKADNSTSVFQVDTTNDYIYFGNDRLYLWADASGPYISNDGTTANIIVRPEGGNLSVQNGYFSVERASSLTGLTHNPSSEGGCLAASDLATDSSNAALVSSASYSFVTADQGGQLEVTGGSGWAVGRYLILSVSGGEATLASAPAAVSQTGGSYTLNRGRQAFQEGSTDTLQVCSQIGGAYAWRDQTSVSNYLPGVLYSAAGTPLPSCGSGIQGEQATVSDATSPTYMAAYSSGGHITAAVICSYNGSSYSWLTH